ncbi:hypothetical protein ACR31S_01685 [Streptococcus iniae]
MELAEKMRENTFDFNDFIDQLDQVQNMGPMEDLLKMIPGMAGNPALANIRLMINKLLVSVPLFHQ